MNFKFFLILLCSVIFFQAQAQVNSAFFANVTNGCSPLAVTFTDQSTGVGINSWIWNFGNGNSATTQDAYATYVAPGVYTVSLTVSNGTSQSTSSQVITVYANPTASFSVNPTSGCKPLVINFTDNTTEGSGPITEWDWDFGDGFSSSIQNPVHSFQANGNYTVTLIVTDENGCTSNSTQGNLIHVTAPPVIHVSANDVYACSPPLNVTFTNTSTGISPLTYSWDLGNGETSTSTSPSTTYSLIGVYDVSLTVTDANGCSTDTVLNDYIGVTDVIASFTVGAQDTLCKGVAYTFNNTSIGGTQFSWNFGDGGVSALANPQHTYANAGTYNVMLVSTENTQCRDTAYQTVVVESLTASFSESANYWCDVPFDVTFTDNTASNIVSWSWNFGDGSTSSDETPTHTYNQEGAYTPSLLVTNNHGCTATVNGTPVIIQKPDVTIDFDTNKVCIPIDINFTGGSNSAEPVVIWNWDFSDGNTANVQNPVNTFSTAGDYMVYLEIENSVGCKNIDSVLIEVGDSLVPLYTIDTTATCAKEMVTFTDVTLPEELPDQWWWSFGEDEGESTQQEATHTYMDTTGVFVIQHIVGYNGCLSDTVVDSVKVFGPIAELEKRISCDSPFVYVFHCHIIDGMGFTLDFGDGHDTTLTFTDTSLFINITHIYDSTLAGQDFNVQLTAYNDTVNSPDGCDYEASALAQVRDVHANFKIDDTLACSYQSVNFNALDPDSTTQDASTYAWAKIDTNNVLTQIGTGSSVNHTFNVSGHFNIRLIATDVNGCSDTTFKDLNVYKTTPDFKADTLIGCTPFDVTFMDITIPDTTLTTWQWSFGDGNVITGGDENDTILHTYNLIQNNTVILTLTDVLGCTWSLTKNYYITATKPKPAFTIPDLTLCAGDSIHFTNSTVGYGTVSYWWHFGDGDSSNVLSPWHQYSDSGNFQVTIYAVDQLGCDTTWTKPDIINVQAIPIAGFMADTTVSDCYPGQFVYTDTTISDYLNSWIWTFGDGAGATLQNPGHTYVAPGYYDVSLMVSTTNGCKDTIVKPQYLRVKGPLANITVPEEVCPYDTIQFFVADTSELYSVIIDFADGSSYTGLDNPISHIYQNGGSKLIVYTLTSDSIHTCDVVLLPEPNVYYSDSLYVHEIDISFNGGIDNCVPYNALFTDASTSAMSPMSSWNWDFGDGTTSASQNPVHNYSVPGTYTVKLEAGNQFGCTDDFEKTFTVFPLPVATASNDTTICYGENVNLNATGGETYYWSPSLYLSPDNQIQNPVSTPDQDITYNVIVTDNNGCNAYENVSIHVMLPFVLDVVMNYNGIDYTGDTVEIIMGDSVFINVITDSLALYSWEPNINITCIDCPNPTVYPRESQFYLIKIQDTLNCQSEVEKYIYIDVLEATLDVPSAFTPNGDNNGNDVVFVRGWGLEKLLEFKIFNRWGQMIFSSEDLNVGWDGTYNGEPQNPDTYVYLVKAETFNGKILTKKGYITLIR